MIEVRQGIRDQIVSPFFEKCVWKERISDNQCQTFKNCEKIIEDPDREILTMNEWKQLCVKVIRLEDDMELETEGSSSTYDES